jgi:CRP-like cAMP-binding protein
MAYDPFVKIKAYFFGLVPELNDEKWQNFMQVMKVRHVKKGEVLIKPGQIERRVSYINHGLLRMYHLLDGKVVIHSFFLEDCYYSAYESFLSQQPSSVYTDVVEDAELIDISYSDLQELYRLMPECERAG